MNKKIRICLTCSREFESLSSANRICSKCRVENTKKYEKTHIPEVRNPKPLEGP